MSSAPYIRIISLTLLLLLPAGASGRSKFHSEHASGITESPVMTYSVQNDGTITDPYVPWPTHYGVQQTGIVNACFDCYGVFGRGFSSWSSVIGWPPAVAFESPPGSYKEYLFAGAFWIGGIIGDDTLVSTGLDGWSSYGEEFQPPGFPAGSVTRFNYPADYSIRALSTDAFDYIDPYSGVEHNPLNIQISNRSHVWRTPQYEDIVIHDATLTNLGETLIEKTYIGLYFDADVGHRYVHTGLPWLDDITGSLKEHLAGYTIDNNGDPIDNVYDPATAVEKIFVLKVMALSHPTADTNFNWWMGAYTDPAEDFGPRMKGTPEDPFRDFGTGGLGIPEGDANKYYLLSHREWDYDQIYTSSVSPDDPVWSLPPQETAASITRGSDTKFLISFGPIDLEPDSSVRILFATFTADNVHISPSNIDNLPDNPDEYLAALSFEDVLTNIERVNELTDLLTDPLGPVTGLNVVNRQWDSVTVGWDPWLFNDILGYRVYLSEVPDDSLPYPGLVPPWLRPTTLKSEIPCVTETHYTFSDLDPNKFYFVNVAHRTHPGKGSEGFPLVVNQRGPTLPPVPESKYAYFYPGDPTMLSWSEPANCDVDHYNIYRFSNQASLDSLYRPFYSRYIPPGMTPKDTFEVGDTTYYYFALEPMMSVDSATTSLNIASPVNGDCYVMTAVDKHGFETDFSSATQLCEKYPTTRDILLITKQPGATLTDPDTVLNFYEEILVEYDYDIFSVSDTTYKYGGYDWQDSADWRCFTPFKLVLIDFQYHDFSFTRAEEEENHHFEKYLLSGGRLAYFGSLYRLTTYYPFGVAAWYEQNDFLVKPYFGIDELFFPDYQFYHYEGLPRDTDTCFGFLWAEPTVSDLPEIAFDTLRSVFTEFFTWYYWQDKTAPSVSTFKLNENGEEIYRYRSRYPEDSWLEGQPVGVKTFTEQSEAYLFGFHLWYMQHEPARQLIDAIFNDTPTGIDDADPGALPAKFSLQQNYPNPFNPSTIVSFELPRSARVTLKIYNILGQCVKTLIDGNPYAAGSHTVEWRGDNDAGRKLASGIYFCRLTTGTDTATRKMMLIK